MPYSASAVISNWLPQPEPQGSDRDVVSNRVLVWENHLLRRSTGFPFISLPALLLLQHHLQPSADLFTTRTNLRRWIWLASSIWTVTPTPAVSCALSRSQSSRVTTLVSRIGTPHLHLADFQQTTLSPNIEAGSSPTIHLKPTQTKIDNRSTTVLFVCRPCTLALTISNPDDSHPDSLLTRLPTGHYPSLSCPSNLQSPIIEIVVKRQSSIH